MTRSFFSKNSLLFSISSFFAIAGNSAVITDTVFLQKGKLGNVYIDTNRNSAAYDDVRPFENTICHDLTRKGVIGKWCRLFQHKGKYYVYKPCDAATNLRYEVTATAITTYGSDIRETQIVAITPKNKNQFTLRLADQTWLNIYITDQKKGIAVFEYVASNGTKTYRTMVSADDIMRFPVIVNDCKNGGEEILLDMPDYKGLMKKIPGVK